MKKIIIPLVIIIILIGITGVMFIPKKSVLDSTDKDSVVREETNENEIKNIEVEPEIDEKPIEESIIVDNDPIPKEETSVPKEVEEKKETISTETVDKNNSNSVTKEEPKKEEVVPKKEEVVPKEEEVKSKTAWEELGISEYDYYHKPMWSWGRVDFSIETYKTYEKTREACITKGEEYFEQGLGYSCTSINSYSGDYLGEMIKTF